MNFYQLFDYETSSDWIYISDLLKEANVSTLDDVRQLISNLGRLSDDVEFRTLDKYFESHDEKEIIKVFQYIIKYAQGIRDLFPTGKIVRLNESNQTVQLRRAQILCLLCHMTLCTLKKNKKNFYWVTFEKWLTDGGPCAMAYLQTLFEYFRQSFETENIQEDSFMNETVRFVRHSADIRELTSIIEASPLSLTSVELKLDGGIGDEPYPEVDFANCDIGYGVTGTQEEMLFGASPELCVAMLFCDTLKSNEAVSLTGARKVASLAGYGLNVSVKSFVDQRAQPTWTDRVIIAMDAVDLSDELDDTFNKQLSTDLLNRELVKAYAGFSSVKDTKISTGHWGCGCFGGNKQLKALIQTIAASLTHNQLIFYSHSDRQFTDDFDDFLTWSRNNHILVVDVWKCLLAAQRQIDNNQIFEFIKIKLSKK